MPKCFAFDVDETLSISKGPIPIECLLTLMEQGHMVGLCGNWGYFASVVPEWWKYINFTAVGMPKDEWLRHFKQYAVGVDEYIMVGNILGISGASDDKGAAERAGWTFCREWDFVKKYLIPTTVEPKKFAFDWGGSLENNESLRQIARDLYNAGHEIHIIPAAGIEPTDETYAIWLLAIRVPWHGFHRILVTPESTPESTAAGKVAKMKELGCHIIYDDNPHNLAAVRAAGMEAVEIRGNNPVPRPPEVSIPQS